jgi:hypothetical protein
MYAAWKIDLDEKCYSLQALDVVSLACSAKVLKQTFVGMHSETINRTQFAKIMCIQFKQ